MGIVLQEVLRFHGAANPIGAALALVGLIRMAQDWAPAAPGLVRFEEFLGNLLGCVPDKAMSVGLAWADEVEAILALTTTPEPADASRPCHSL